MIIRNCKKKKFNTIERNINDSIINMNNDSKRYNMKTINQEIVLDNKDNNVSYSFKIKKSIKYKEQLLILAQERSHKFMEKQKAEKRTLNIASIKHQKNKYIGINSTININHFSSKGKRNPDKKKDLILDNIIYCLNRNSKYSKYEKILNFYLSKNNNDNIKEYESEEKKGKNEDKNGDSINI